jgi:hypothetical protein
MEDSESPAELRRDLGITPRDLFIVSAEANAEGNLVIEYERFHEAATGD